MIATALTAASGPGAALLTASLHAALLAGVVGVVTLVAGTRLPPAWRCGLWLLVFARLALPAVPETDLSPLRLIPPPPSDRPTAGRRADSPAASRPPPAGPVFGAERRGFAPTVSRPVPPPVAAARSRVGVDLPVILAAVWLAGLILLCVRFGRSWFRLRRVLAGCTEVTDPAVLALRERCRAEAGVRRPVRLVRPPTGSVGEAFGPAVSGVVRPTVLLTPGLLAGPPEALRCVLLHEMAHVRRLDVPADRLISLLCAVHWFNPAAWWAAARWRAAREITCDAAVLSRLDPADRPAYGRLVLSLSLRPAGAAPTVGAGSGARSLPERIAMIAAYTPPTRRRTAASAAVLLACAAVGLTAAGPPETEPSTGEPAPPVAVAEPAAEGPAGTTPARESRPAPDATRAVLTGPVQDGEDRATDHPHARRAADPCPGGSPGGFRAAADVDGEGLFRLRVPRGAVRLSTDPVLSLVGSQDTAASTDAIGASFWIDQQTMTQLAVLTVLPPWPVMNRPVGAERAAAEAVTVLGGTYELNDARHVVKVDLGAFRMWRDDTGRMLPDGPTSETDVTRLLALFPELRTARVPDGRLTDGGLAAVGSLPNLRELILPGEPSDGLADGLTAAGVSRLVDIAPKLERFLTVGQGDDVASVLATAPALRRVVLGGGPVSDTGVRALATGLPRLTELQLHGSRVTDAGVRSLAGLRELKILALDDSRITDAALETVADLPALEQLTVAEGEVSGAALRTLQRRRPELKILTLVDGFHLVPFGG